MSYINSIQGHLVIIISIEHYNPLSMIRSLGKNNIYPIYIAIKGKGKIASSSKYLSKCHYVDSVEQAYDVLIQEYGNENKKPFILTGDDITISYLDKKYDELKDKFIFFNAGESNAINKYMDKQTILSLGKKCGLPILKTHCVDINTIPKDIEYPVITKSISSVVGGWKSDVFICNNEEELRQAYKKIKSSKVILQKYIDKKNEYVIEGFSINSGKDVYFSIATKYNYLIKGYYSPYLTVYEADNNYINDCLKNMLSEIKFEGVFEAEFLIDQDDTIYFEEINFRNSPWTYPSALLGRPLLELWMRSMLENKLIMNKTIIPENYTAMNEPVDYDKRVNSNMISLAKWIYDFKTANVTFYFDEDDVEPYYLMMENKDIYS